MKLLAQTDQEKKKKEIWIKRLKLLKPGIKVHHQSNKSKMDYKEIVWIIVILTN